MSDNVLQIINDCLSDKEGGWDLFFKEYASVAMNILNHHFPSFSQADKDDVIQNIFSKLLKGGLKNFQGTNKYEFLAYFKKIATNEARTYLEYAGKWKTSVSLDQGKNCADDILPPLEIPDNKPLPDVEMEGNELVKLIHTVLDGVPVETKQIFLMKAEGYKDKEVSDILGISMGTVASRYSRIREKLRRLLGNNNTEEKH